MSSFLWTLDPAGTNITASSLGSPATQEALFKHFPNRDIHKTTSSLYRAVATNIFRTKDDRFFHVHSEFDFPYVAGHLFTRKLFRLDEPGSHFESVGYA